MNINARVIATPANNVFSIEFDNNPLSENVEVYKGNYIQF